MFLSLWSIRTRKLPVKGINELKMPESQSITRCSRTAPGGLTRPISSTERPACRW